MDRRRAIASLCAAAGALATTIASAPARAAGDGPLRRAIPKGRGETIPAVGLGTWLTFDIGDAAAERARRGLVIDALLAGGGGMIDSSPMYGRAERVVGDLLATRGHAGRVFSATKVWTPFERQGPEQAAESLRLWRLPRLDLLYVHNLLQWSAHLKTLRALKERGQVRYIGVTTSHGRRHDEMLDVMRREPLDFIQITYSPADTSAERVIDEAAGRGIAVVANRPFDGGALVDRANRLPLPGWARELGCDAWAQVLLKWIVARPGVVCAIPATTDPAHMTQNMGALHGPLPDAAMRRRILEHLQRSP